MKIQINKSEITLTDSLSKLVHDCLEHDLELWADRVTRVEVHLHDDKNKRRGPDDKRCLMEIRLAGEQPLAVEARDGDLYNAIRLCSEKLARAVGRKLDRKNARVS